MSVIVVIGESIVDRLISASGVTATAGGSPANVAIGLGRLGDPVTLITELGPDADGDLIRAHLRASGVGLIDQPVARTSTSAARIDADGTATYDFDVTWTLVAEPLPAGCELVHVGSLGTVVNPGAAAVFSMLAAGLPVSYDPNLRGMPDAAVRSAVELMAGRAQLIKASHEDLALLHPDRAVAETARRWVAAGTALVVVTAAGSGNTAFSVEHEVHCPAVPVEVVDTVGAGDAFMAALLHHLRGRDWSTLGADALQGALAFASRAAAVVCGRAGADPASLAEL